MKVVTLEEKIMKIYFAAKKLYQHRPDIVTIWEQAIQGEYQEKDGQLQINSKSFSALYTIIDLISKSSNIEIDEIVQEYGDKIEIVLEESIKEDLLGVQAQSKKLKRKRGNTRSSNQEIITELLKQSHIESNSDALIYQLRDAISKNTFKQGQMLSDPYPTVKIMDKKKVKAVAQLRADDNEELGLTKEELGIWENLIGEAITSMDDLTSDIFDIISYVWMKKAHHPDAMINFHSDDVLSLRQLQGRFNGKNSSITYRKKQREEVMKRIAALAAIWVRLDENDELELVDRRKHVELSDYKSGKFKRLFLMDNITVLYDNNDNPVGIYECSIKPGQILANYLYGSTNSVGYLSLKALEYNPEKEKYHKRLTRYLSWQWRIRKSKRDFLRPYSIGGEKGLLSVMEFKVENRYASRTKDGFEKVLNTLKDDGVIGDWEYEGGIDETIIGRKKGWLENYWLHLKVVIHPPHSVLEHYRIDARELTALPPDKPASLKDTKALLSFLELDDQEETYENPIEYLAKKEIKRTYRESTYLEEQEGEEENGFGKQMTLFYGEDIDITGELIKEVRKKRGLNITEAAEQIGIGRTTLSRFERGMIEKPLPDNIEKMKKWILEG
ncbi:helix-turn-helix domain-containing protein [Bacillus songklensis]|uniref:Helix-turn-helix domain-containing protein n=1 Tax=Bacillus songklensis TaxID=1069116 RepID=A0ABV8AVJ4_9BACI